MRGRAAVVTVDAAYDEYSDKLLTSMIRQSLLSREEFYGATEVTARKIGLRATIALAEQVVIRVDLSGLEPLTPTMRILGQVYQPVPTRVNPSGSVPAIVAERRVLATRINAIRVLVRVEMPLAAYPAASSHCLPGSFTERR